MLLYDVTKPGLCKIFGTRRRTVINITSWLFPSVFQEIYIITAIRPPPVNVHVACRVQTRLTSSSVRSLQLTWLIFSRANNTRLNPSLFPLACDKRDSSHDLIYGMWSTRLGDTRQTHAELAFTRGWCVYSYAVKRGLLIGQREERWKMMGGDRSTSQEPLTWHMPLFKWQRAMYGRMWLLHWMLEDTLLLGNALCSPLCEKSWAR